MLTGRYVQQATSDMYVKPTHARVACVRVRSARTSGQQSLPAATSASPVGWSLRGYDSNAVGLRARKWSATLLCLMIDFVFVNQKLAVRTPASCAERMAAATMHSGVSGPPHASSSALQSSWHSPASTQLLRTGCVMPRGLDDSDQRDWLSIIGQSQIDDLLASEHASA